MTLTSLRNTLVLLVISLYLILNWGFMLVRIPPSGASGVPIGELLLILSLLIVSDVKWLPSFSRSINLLPFVVWWTLGLSQAFWGVSTHGMWALRDATHVIESLFLWVGFVFAAKPQEVDRLFNWLNKVLFIACIYGLTYPFREALKAYSPTIQAAAGYTSTVFFNYTNSQIMMLTAAARLLIFRLSFPPLTTLIIVGILIGYVATLFQQRTIYVQLIVFTTLFLIYRRDAFGKLGLGFSVGAICLALLMAADIKITGRLGQSVSADFLFRHFQAIFGIEAEGVVGAARGVGQRFGWWEGVWLKVSSSLDSLLFGLGYGFPLIEFSFHGRAIVREPHNSFISILGRTGIVGFTVFIWGHILLARAWFRAYRICAINNYRLGQDRLLLMLVFFLLVGVYTMGEDAFEKPFIAIPYYFFWGVVLHYGVHLKRAFPAGASAADPRSAGRHPRPAMNYPRIAGITRPGTR